MTELVPTTLTAEEVELLADCERTIERGLTAFIETGTALAAVRDSRLYRAEFATFEDYCQARWGFTRQRAHQITSAAEIASSMFDAGLPVPDNSRQAAELARVPEEQRADVWQATVEATGGKPTAAAIRNTYENTQTPASTPEPAPATDVDPPARATNSPLSRAEEPADVQPAADPTTPGVDGQAVPVFRGTGQAGEQGGPVALPSSPVLHLLPDFDALTAEARARYEAQEADRRALLAPREVVDAVNAATHFVPALVAIQAGCEDLLRRVADVDPGQAVTDLPEHWRNRLDVARTAHQYLTRVVEALDQIGVPA